MVLVLKLQQGWFPLNFHCCYDDFIESTTHSILHYVFIKVSFTYHQLWLSPSTTISFNAELDIVHHFPHQTHPCHIILAFALTLTWVYTVMQRIPTKNKDCSTRSNSPIQLAKLLNIEVQWTKLFHFEIQQSKLLDFEIQLNMGHM